MLSTIAITVLVTLAVVGLAAWFGLGLMFHRQAGPLVAIAVQAAIVAAILLAGLPIWAYLATLPLALMAYISGKA